MSVVARGAADAYAATMQGIERRLVAIELQVTGNGAAWIDATMENSWAAGSPAPAYIKFGNVVYLRGQCSGGTSASVAFTLPKGFQPLTKSSYAVSVDLTSAPVSVDTNGDVTLFDTGTFNLNAIVFPVI